jgi:hypothetical protein
MILRNMKKPALLSLRVTTYSMLVFLTVCASNAKAAVTIPNSSFEATVGPPTVLAAGGSLQYFEGDTIGAWQVASGMVTLYDGANTLGLSAPNDGAQALLLHGNVGTHMFSGSVSQLITGLAPGLWQLEFAYGNAGAGNGAVEVQVYAGGNPQPQVFSTDLAWAVGTFDFQIPANQNSITISFGSSKVIGGPAVIDGLTGAHGMTLTAVPEPAAFGFVGLFGMLGFAARSYFCRRK